MNSWSIQLQFDNITINLQASSLAFLQQMSKFINVTINNPDYRDSETERGIFRTAPEQSCDLSAYFKNAVKIMKDGEYDDSYSMSIAFNKCNWVHLSIRGNALNNLINELEIAIDEWSS